MRTRQVNEGRGFGAFFGEDGDGPAAPGEDAPGPSRPIAIALPRRRTSVDALLPLINIVFLLLIFLMMSGTIGTPLPGDVSVARAASADDPAMVAGALVVLPDGRLRRNGREIDPADLAAAFRGEDGTSPERLTVVADGGMPAGSFLALMRRLSESGVASVSLVTAKAPAAGGGARP